MHRSQTRRSFLAAAGVAALAGCLGGGTDAGSDSGSAGGSGSGPPSAAATLPMPRAPEDLRQRAVSGGPPKDGIPSIDDPTFVDADSASSVLDPDEPVFGVATETDVKAYPQAILVSHEICNDVVDGTPVSVTYCPLTGTAMGFERGETTFGVSGRLVNNNLIMYDRATETWWPQVLGTSIPGPWNESPGTSSLREFRLVWTTWERWQAAHPETAVLSRDTGFARNYDSDPYGSYDPRGGYYAPAEPPLFESLSDDDRLEPNTVAVGTRKPAGATAVEKAALREQRLVASAVGDTPVLAVYDPTLDTGYVYRNPEADSFEHDGSDVIDQSGERYAPDSLPLERVLAFDAMWFAWSGFYPDTTLHD